MASYRLLGQATTNSQGVATIEYTGVGAGKLNLIASTSSNPSTSGSLVSEIYEVLDCVQYDAGTTGTVNTNWKNTGSLTSATSDSTGTTFTNDTGNTISVYFNKADTTTAEFDWSYPLCFEFDLVANTGVTYWQFRSTNSANAPNLSNYISQNTQHLKMIVTDSTMSFYVDDTLIRSYTYDNTNYTMRFVLNTEASITFKNLKVYPV